MTNLCLFFLIFQIHTVSLKSSADKKVFNFHPNHPIYRRIMKGVIAKPDDWTFMVAMNCYNKTMITFCSGTLIKKDWVLTAGHCIPDSIRVINGTVGRFSLNKPGGQIFEAVLAIRHPDYKNENGVIQNDIALIKLARSVVLSTIQLVKFADDPLIPKTSCKTVGWGISNADEEGDDSVDINLYEIKLTTISLSNCRTIMGDDVLFDSIVCTNFRKKGKNPCLGK